MRSANMICWKASSGDSSSPPPPPPRPPSSSSASSSRSRLRRFLASQSVTTPLREQCLAISGVWRRVRTMGTGSAIPVVSISTPSSGLPDSIAAKIDENAPRMSPRTEQHMQPLSMTITCSAALCCVETRSASMGTAPNSFSMTAIFLPRCSYSRWLSNVVLPAPRNPVSTVIGILLLGAAAAAMGLGGSVGSLWECIFAAGRRPPPLPPPPPPPLAGTMSATTSTTWPSSNSSPTMPSSGSTPSRPELSTSDTRAEALVVPKAASAARASCWIVHDFSAASFAGSALSPAASAGLSTRSTVRCSAIGRCSDCFREEKGLRDADRLTSGARLAVQPAPLSCSPRKPNLIIGSLLRAPHGHLEAAIGNPAALLSGPGRRWTCTAARAPPPAPGSPRGRPN